MYTIPLADRLWLTAGMPRENILEGTVRRNVLMASLVVCCLAGPSSTSALALTQPVAVQSAEPLRAAWPANGEPWLWEEMLEGPTIPLGPYWLDPWPFGLVERSGPFVTRFDRRDKCRSWPRRVASVC